MSLSPDQQEATDKFKSFLMHPTQKEMVISGSPGRGKSWLTKHLMSEAHKISKLCQILKGEGDNIDILTTATTNKAAEVLGKFVGQETNTVHSTLGIRPTYNFKTKKSQLVKTNNYQILENTLLIIDEVSGIDPILQSMIRSSTHNCKVLKVGDKRQLAAVGELTCCEFDNPEVFAELTTGQRFATGSGMGILGTQMEHTIDTGIFTPLKVNGIEAEYINGEDFERLINHHYTLDTIGTNHAKIVCWSNWQVNEYNAYIRSLHTDSVEFLPGETVVSNGVVCSGGRDETIILRTEQICTVLSVSPITRYKNIDGWWVNTSGGEVFQPLSQAILNTELKRLQDSGQYFEKNKLKTAVADLRPLHASTTYKAQGSTYDVTFVDLDDIGKCACWSTVARMLNVAFSRPTQKLYLYGQLPARYQDRMYELPKPTNSNTSKRVPF